MAPIPAPNQAAKILAVRHAFEDALLELVYDGPGCCDHRGGGRDGGGGGGVLLAAGAVGEPGCAGVAACGGELRGGASGWGFDVSGRSSAQGSRGRRMTVSPSTTRVSVRAAP